MEDIVKSLVVPILTSIISYIAATKQSKTELQKVKEQNKIELERIKEQHRAEVEKIREQSLQDMRKLELEMEKQAELYEKNKQTDIVSKIFERLLSGDLDIDKVMKLVEKSEKIMKKDMQTRKL